MRAMVSEVKAAVAEAPAVPPPAKGAIGHKNIAGDVSQLIGRPHAFFSLLVPQAYAFPVKDLARVEGLDFHLSL